MSWLTRLEKRLGFLAIPHLLAALLAGQVLVYLALALGAVNAEDLLLTGQHLMEGELPRLLTFLFLPMASSPLWFAIGLSVTWMIGSSLETQWGNFRFTLFFLSGWLATVLAAIAFPEEPATHLYLYASLSLAFARLFPDFEFLAFFIIPVKARYFALLQKAAYAGLLLFSPNGQRALLLAGLLPYFLFFGRDILLDLHRLQRRGRFLRKSHAHTATPTHTCTLCGRDSSRHPDLDFRYRSGACICESCLREGK